jgi:7,8-dihydropterin-6-yl-methyl-4-(beta-D-ribofuranosyl)aminobenzene 5'-phosphate synthase
MATAPVDLKPVDAVEVTIVMDLSLDVLIAGAEGVRRFPVAYDWTDRDCLLAEHGFSALVTVESGGSRNAVLYDAGLSANAVRQNLDVMDIDLTNMRALAISHGHADHHGGLEGFFSRYGRMRMPLVIHPDAWLDRKVLLPTGVELHMPPPNRNDLEREGLTVVDERGPTLLIDDTVLVSGQVRRTTDFERGFPGHLKRGAGGWEPDPLIEDDQNLIVNVRGKGLVIVSGCSHSGAINVCRNARALTNEARIAAFIGGFHLTGGLFEPIIPATVEALREFDIGRLVPAHCTGWRATHMLARTFPDAFVQPSVGTVFRFEA